MPVIMVGGQTKNVGKTALICNIISAFSRLRWTAAKFTNHTYHPTGCDQLAQGVGWTIWKQILANESSDTGRFLSAGAKLAFLVQAEESALEEASAALQREIPQDNFGIVESASAAEFLNPDLFLLILDSAKADFKQSAQQHLASADALVWKGPVPEIPDEFMRTAKPQFQVTAHGLGPSFRSWIAKFVETCG